LIRELHTKVCIIGAGPAGATTAIFLGKEKVEHIIIDVATFPRDKTCGDGLDLKAIAVLNNIDKNIIAEEIKPNGRIIASYGFRIITTKGKNVEFNYKPTAEQLPPYGTSKRIDFDNLLIEKLNTTYTNFLQATKATSIIRVNEKWEIIAQQKEQTIKIICDLLVGADGDHSIVLKTIGERKIDRNHYSAGVRQYWQGIANTHQNNLMEVYFPKEYPMSYFWIFPLKNGLSNVGYGMQSNVAAKYNYNVKEIFSSLIKNDKNLQHRFNAATPQESIKGWGIPFASLQRKCFGNGWLLVGDAASMISPTTGEGIGTGMTTGLIAAQFIKRAVEQNKFDESVFKNYDREIYKRTNDDIKLYKLSLWISPKFMGWAMNTFINLNFFQKFFHKKVGQWINSAYNKELKVNLDD
jgi:geranylgeranyl reductase family protein